VLGQKSNSLGDFNGPHTTEDDLVVVAANVTGDLPETVDSGGSDQTRRRVGADSRWRAVGVPVAMVGPDVGDGCTVIRIGVRPVTMDIVRDLPSDIGGFSVVVEELISPPLGTPPGGVNMRSAAWCDWWEPVLASSAAPNKSLSNGFRGVVRPVRCGDMRHHRLDLQCRPALAVDVLEKKPCAVRPACWLFTVARLSRPCARRCTNIWRK
jgi:hypothetical protein